MSEVTTVGWEDFSLTSKMVSLKTAQAGDMWEGFFIRVFDGTMGQLLEIKHPDEGTIIIPFSGVLRKIFEDKMEAKPYDYVRIIYTGEIEISKGRWAGKKCWDFKASRNVIFSGKEKYNQLMLGVEPPPLEPDAVEDAPDRVEAPQVITEAEKPTEEVKRTLTEKELDDFLNGL